MKKIVGDFSTVIQLDVDEAKSICKLGQMSECCAFLVCGTNGFSCMRTAPGISSTIFKRLEEGTMNAKGRGKWEGCPWEGSSA